MSVTAAGGFRAAGVTAGLKPSGRSDLALVVNDGPSAAAAGVFTRNRVQAAPVLWSRQVLAGGAVRAVVLSSGGANACTGPDGFADTHRTAEAVAAALQHHADQARRGGAAQPAVHAETGAAQVAVCATGLIGVRLRMDLLLPGVEQAVGALTPDGGPDAAEAICTTDTVSKQALRRSDAGWALGGMAKGAAMLAPSLATMLCVLTTDAVTTPADLDAALREAVRTTFERLDTDGCLSTNDTVLLLASGASAVTPTRAELTEATRQVCADLAGQLAADAEGASKTIAVTVSSAASEDDAVEVARAVARNDLLKCAVHGEDPNWGRVLAAVGTTAAAFAPDELDVSINGVQVCRAGAPGEDRAGVDMGPRRVSIDVELHAGHATVTVLTTDLTAAYVHENSAYST